MDTILHQSFDFSGAKIALLKDDQIDQIVFGDEGQGWKMMPITDFLQDDQVYGSLKERLGDWMRQES
ncbi:hypothetical protein [Streptococcus pluranimalium]|uniref:Uncharacterized protein n=1 Tax=Streptococcus pluranimalium TaxID=82348 RepID=A0A345VMV9_9STRE|nr:hypothetical protein [Streptococcus pluranimalium]AXJ14061.1 hypothetical protein Sp14A_21770 [Streptococcus pluranimalium]